MGNKDCASCAFSAVDPDAEPCKSCCAIRARSGEYYAKWQPYGATVEKDSVVVAMVDEANKARREHMALTLMAALLAGNSLGKTQLQEYAAKAVRAADILMEALDG